MRRKCQNVIVLVVLLILAAKTNQFLTDRGFFVVVVAQ